MSASNIRLRTTGTHMAIAMAVLVIPLILLVSMCQPGASTAPTIDADRVYDAAEREAGFPIERPHALPKNYRATNSALRRHTGGTMTVRVTYRTGDGKALQFVQTNRDATTAIEDGLGHTSLDTVETVANRSWQRYPLERTGETGYVLLEPERTVYVAGDPSRDDLRAFITTLH